MKTNEQQKTKLMTTKENIRSRLKDKWAARRNTWKTNETRWKSRKNNEKTLNTKKTKETWVNDEKTKEIVEQQMKTNEQDTKTKEKH